MAKKKAVAVKSREVVESTEKQAPAEKPSAKKPVMLVTTNMSVSEKLQKAGIKVIAVAGGTSVADKKRHYLATSIDSAKKLVGAGKQPLLSEEELEAIQETDEIKKSVSNYSDLEQRVKSKKHVVREEM